MRNITIPVTDEQYNTIQDALTRLDASVDDLADAITAYCNAELDYASYQGEKPFIDCLAKYITL